MPHALLDRALLAVSGEEARGFLQGLLTVDVLKLAPRELRYAMLLSPQGKFLHEMFLRAEKGHIILDVPAARAEDLRKRLLMYRLRAKVEIAPVEGKVFALWSAPAPHALADPRLPALGYRLYDNAAPAGEPGDYEAHRLSLGVPDANDFIIDRTLPLEWGVGALHAVDFDKGCYVGQEVTARMRHRAVMRHYIHQARAEENLPPFGTPVLIEGKEIGTLHSARGTIGLARLSLEAVSQAESTKIPLTAGRIPLTARVPDWTHSPISET